MSNVKTLTLVANLESLVGFSSVIVGLLLIFAPGTQLFTAYNLTIAAAFWGAQSLPADAMALNHWLLATCGAGVVGWGIAWSFISHIPLRAGEKWAWRCLVVSLLVWGVLDLCIALWFGVTGEVVFVLTAVLLALLPLLLSAKEFGRNH